MHTNKWSRSCHIRQLVYAVVDSCRENTATVQQKRVKSLNIYRNIHHQKVTQNTSKNVISSLDRPAGASSGETEEVNLQSIARPERPGNKTVSEFNSKL